MFIDLARTGDESAPRAIQRSDYGLLGYMSRSETIYAGTQARAVTHTTFSASAICLNALVTVTVTVVTLALARRALWFGTLARPGVMALHFAGVGFLLPISLLIAYYSVHWWPFAARFIWPTAFLLVATQGIIDRFWYEMVTVAIVLNVGIFAAAGFAASLAVRTMMRRLTIAGAVREAR
jgi:hypothetical protein